MNVFARYAALLGLSLTPVFASATCSHHHLEVSGQLGIANLHLGNATYAPTPTETDELHETSNQKTPEFGLGLNGVMPINLAWQYRQWQFLPYVKLGVNLRYLPQEVTGDIYQYEDADMNNYQYTLSLDSTRLMLDASIGLLSFNEKTSLYLIGGIGRAWTRLNYDDMPITDVEGGSLSLNSRTSAGVAYEFGAGITHTLSHDATLFVEYRYTKLPSLNTSSQGNLSGMPVSVAPAHFRFFIQTIALGVNWNI